MLEFADVSEERSCRCLESECGCSLQSTAMLCARRAPPCAAWSRGLDQRVINWGDGARKWQRGHTLVTTGLCSAEKFASYEWAAEQHTAQVVAPLSDSRYKNLVRSVLGVESKHRPFVAAQTSLDMYRSGSIPIGLCIRTWESSRYTWRP